MGLLDRFRSRRPPGLRDLPPDHELKGWTVRHSPAHGDGGWRQIDGWELLDEPITKTEFEINTGDLDPGTYSLFWIQADTERFQSPPEAVAWTKTIEPSEEPDRADPDAIADRAADRVLGALQQDDEQPPEEQVARQRAIIQLALLNNAAFVAKHGEAIALAEFGIHDSSDGLAFAEYEDNPIGAFLYDTYRNPERMRGLGTYLGAGGGEFFEGLIEGTVDPEAVLGGEIEQAQAEADAARGEDFEPTPSRAAEITSVEDLTDGVDENLADQLATAIRPDEADPTTSREPAHAGASAEPTDDGAELPIKDHVCAGGGESADGPGGDEDASDDEDLDGEAGDSVGGDARCGRR